MSPVYRKVRGSLTAGESAPSDRSPQARAHAARRAIPCQFQLVGIRDETELFRGLFPPCEGADAWLLLHGILLGKNVLF
jgi:hypothetical protein